MQEVNITPETGDDTQAHIDAMVAKADAAADGQKETPAVNPADAPERPAWLPEKFSTPEDMAKAYGEMEKKQSGPKDPAAPETPEIKPEDADAAAAAAVEGAGLDLNALGAKIVDNGDIDEADYEALAKQGITKEIVQSYVQGQQALGEQLVTRMHATVGGEEAFNSLLTWSSENLNPTEIAAFNKTIDTGSEASVQMALQGIQARFAAVNGKAPNLMGGKTAANTAGDVFRSTAEVTRAMGDARYTKDAAYRADVMAKLGRSNVM